MKQYEKAQLDIVEFRKNTEILTGSGDIYDPFMNMGTDEVFIDEEEGYIG